MFLEQMLEQYSSVLREESDQWSLLSLIAILESSDAFYEHLQKSLCHPPHPNPEAMTILFFNPMDPLSANLYRKMFLRSQEAYIHIGAFVEYANNLY